jgi:hypothetical protein
MSRGQGEGARCVGDVHAAVQVARANEGRLWLVGYAHLEEVPGYDADAQRIAAVTDASGDHAWDDRRCRIDVCGSCHGHP